MSKSRDDSGCQRDSQIGKRFSSSHPQARLWGVSEGEVFSWPISSPGAGRVSRLPGLEGGLAPRESTARPALGPEGEGASGLT